MRLARPSRAYLRDCVATISGRTYAAINNDWKVLGESAGRRQLSVLVTF